MKDQTKSVINSIKQTDNVIKYKSINDKKKIMTGLNHRQPLKHSSISPLSDRHIQTMAGLHMFVSVQSILPLEWNFKRTFFLLVFRGTKTVKGNDTDASETQRWLSFKYLSSNYFKSCRKAQKSSYFWQYISVDIKLLCFSRMYDKGTYQS